MTEKQWLTSAHPAGMLGFLGDTVSGRKLRLLACACCRLVWPLLTDEWSRRAVETAERYADGQASPQELETACQGAAEVANALPDFTRERALATAAWFTARTDWPATANALLQLAWVRNTAPRGKAGRQGRAERRGTMAAQAALLRDLIPNPFYPVTINPAWLAWQDGTVCRLAQAIYDERRFADLPILADALEEAGCANPDLLAHCRGGGEHVRGCWGVDLILGRS